MLVPTDKDRGLQSLSGIMATPEQARDIQQFHEIGNKHFESYVRYHILREPSAKVPQRKNRLLTFSTSKKSRRKIKAVDRERKVVNRCVRRQIAWQMKTGEVQQCQGEQYLELPRAICNPHGNPHKGQNSFTTKWLEKRYKGLTVTQLPDGWVPNVVLEGMFLINTVPLGTHSKMQEYATFLLRCFVLPHLVSGTQEVHIVFDSPRPHSQSPKAFEQKRRDVTKHFHQTINTHTSLTAWLFQPSGVKICLAGLVNVNW